MALPSLQEREQFIIDELSKRGYQPHQVAAIAGSIKQESSFSPSIQEQGGTGLGLFQWSYDRRKKVPALTGDFRTDARNQINLFEQELSGPEKKAGDMLRGATDLKSAAAAMKQFERYGVAGNRYNYMNDYLKKLQGGQLSASQPASSESSIESLLGDLPSMGGGTKPLGGFSAAGLVGGVGAGPFAGSGDTGVTQFAGSPGFIAAAAKFIGGAEQPAPQAQAMSAPSLDMPGMQASGGGGGDTIPLVEFGKRLQQMGFKVAENPAFGGVGKHSPNSHHYSGDAFDLTIQPGSRLLAGRPDSDWVSVKKAMGEGLRAALPDAEIFHPGHDPVGGHNSHIHLGLPGASKSGVRLTPGLRKFLGMSA